MTASLYSLETLKVSMSSLVYSASPPSSSIFSLLLGHSLCYLIFSIHILVRSHFAQQHFDFAVSHHNSCLLILAFSRNVIGNPNCGYRFLVFLLQLFLLLLLLLLYSIYASLALIISFFQAKGICLGSFSRGHLITYLNIMKHSLKIKIKAEFSTLKKDFSAKIRK